MSNLKDFRPIIGVASLSSPLEVGANRAEQTAKNLENILRDCGCDVVALGSIDNPAKSLAVGQKIAQRQLHGVVFGVASWFEDYLVLDLLEEYNVPVMLWSLPGMETGALCGTQQLTAYLKQLNYSYECVYADITDTDASQRIKNWTIAAALRKRLRVSKIGATGHRVAGMTEVAVNEFQLKKSIGPRVVYTELAKILDKAKSISNNDVKEKWLELVNNSGSCNVSQQDGLESIKIYTALKQTIEDNGLDALAFGCYPDWMGCACIASSILADQGIAIGCEGDINAVIGQFILMLLTKQPTHNMDWLEPLEDGTVILTHCGSGSFTLSENKENIQLSSVRLMGQGVCALFPAKPGVVTLLSIIPHGQIYQIAMLTGEALHSEMVFPGNPLRVRFKRSASEIIEWIHKEGIGHHWVGGYGDVSEQIKYWASMLGDKLRFITL